jgi:hypothetical protein
MDEEIYLSFKRMIDEICGALQAGDEVKKEVQVKKLCWTWTNTRTQEQWNIMASWIVTAKINDNTNDPRISVIANFAHGRLTAPQTKSWLTKLEKLKAFW